MTKATIKRFMVLFAIGLTLILIADDILISMGYRALSPTQPLAKYITASIAAASILLFSTDKSAAK